MNSKRSPFHVKRYGHDDGLRSSPSAPASSAARRRRRAHRLRAAARPARCWRPARARRPPRRGCRGRIRRRFGLAAGQVLEVSSFCRRLPARSSISEPTALRLLTLPARRTRATAAGCRRHSSARPAARGRDRRASAAPDRCPWSPSTSPDAIQAAPGIGASGSTIYTGTRPAGGPLLLALRTCDSIALVAATMSRRPGRCRDRRTAPRSRPRGRRSPSP